MSKHSSLAHMAATVLVFGWAHAAWAGNGIVKSNNQVGIAFYGNHIDYLETNGSTPMDSEKGWQPGVAISGSVMKNWGIENLYLYGQFSWVNGHSNYVGSYIGGTYGDLKQTDGAEVSNEDFRIGKGFSVNDNFMLTPYVGAGARQWGRNLPGSSGYHEDYSNGYAGGGLMAQFSPASRWVLSVNGLIGSTFGASMKTSLTPGGYAITPQTYNLGSSTIYKIGASVDYAATESIHVNAGVEYTSFNYGKSAISSIDGTYEPDSRTNELAAKIGIGFSF